MITQHHNKLSGTILQVTIWTLWCDQVPSIMPAIWYYYRRKEFLC